VITQQVSWKTDVTHCCFVPFVGWLVAREKSARPSPVGRLCSIHFPFQDNDLEALIAFCMKSFNPPGSCLCLLRPLLSIPFQLLLARRRIANTIAAAQPHHGGVVEWFMAAVLKTAEGKPSVGSNPTPSANL
jgi:hypothetical protein